jgi:hypothetical protein
VEHDIGDIMATGRSNKLIGQTGEYLVAAELSRRGLIATTFTGNVPHYDIIASDECGRHVSVQVKTVRGSSWQFDISRYCPITFDGKRQVVGKPLKCPVQRLVVVFVQVSDDRDDRFYICSWENLRDMLIEGHTRWLDKHGGIRPKNPESLHCTLLESQLVPFRDKWDTVEGSLR